MPKTRLQKQLSRKVGNKEYAKWVVVLPPSIIEELSWNAGDALKHEINNGKLVLSKEKTI